MPCKGNLRIFLVFMAARRTAFNLHLKSRLSYKSKNKQNCSISFFPRATNKRMKMKNKQNCSYQGEALNVPTAFQGLWSSNNIKKLNEIKQNKKNFFSKI